MKSFKFKEKDKVVFTVEEYHIGDDGTVINIQNTIGTIMKASHHPDFDYYVKISALGGLCKHFKEGELSSLPRAYIAEAILDKRAEKAFIQDDGLCQKCGNELENLQLFLSSVKICPRCDND